MDGLVPVVSTLRSRFDLCRLPEEIGRRYGATGATAAFGGRDTVVGVEIDKGRINIFPAAIDNHGVLGNGSPRTRRNDNPVPDHQGGIIERGGAVLYQRRMGKGITMF